MSSYQSSVQANHYGNANIRAPSKCQTSVTCVQQTTRECAKAGPYDNCIDEQALLQAGLPDLASPTLLSASTTQDTRS